MPGHASQKPGDVPAQCTGCGFEAVLSPRRDSMEDPERCPKCGGNIYQLPMQPPVQTPATPPENTDPKYKWIDHYGKCPPYRTKMRIYVIKLSY